MARVPTIDAPSVEARPLPAPNVHPAGSAELYGVGAQQNATTGKALLAAGVGGLRVVTDIQERENADLVFRAETALKDDYIAYEQDVLKNRQGRFAENVTADTDKWWKERTAKSLEGLGNKEQQRIFQQRAESLRQVAIHSMSRFQATQMEKSHDEAWSANRSATISQAAANPTPENIDSARIQIGQLNAYQARRKGWQPEATAAQTLADTTLLHENVIKQLALKDPSAAAAYFEQWKKEIDGKRHDEIGKFARDVSANAIGDQLAGVVWAKRKPKNDHGAVELDRMEEEIRESLKGSANESARKAALSAIKERANVFNASVREREAARGSAVANAFLNGATPSQIRAMPEFQSLGGEKKAQMSAYVEAGDEARKQRDYFAAYEIYADPEQLRRMSRNEVMALLPTMGTTLTRSLLAKHDTITKSEEGLTEGRMDADAFASVAREFKFDPEKKGKGNEENVARLGQLRNAVELEVGQFQKDNKRKATREEKDVIARQVFSRTVLRKGWIWDDMIPSAAVLPKDLKNISVPPKDREEIVKALAKHGKPQTNEEIARWYLLKQNRSK